MFGSFLILSCAESFGAEVGLGARTSAMLRKRSAKRLG